MEHADHSRPVFPCPNRSECVLVCQCVCVCECLLAQAWMSALSLSLCYSLCPQSRGKVRVSAQHVDEKAGSVLSLGLDMEHSGLCHGTEKKKKSWLLLMQVRRKKPSVYRNQVSILYKNRRKDWKNCNFIPFYCGCVNDVYICTV